MASTIPFDLFSEYIVQGAGGAELRMLGFLKVREGKGEVAVVAGFERVETVIPCRVSFSRHAVLH